jgi:hypothetical protein
MGGGIAGYRLDIGWVSKLLETQLTRIKFGAI